MLLSTSEKPKLSEGSKRMLLEARFQQVNEFHLDEEEDHKGQFFLKMLRVSRSFLECSQKFDIFHLKLSMYIYFKMYIFYFKKDKNFCTMFLCPESFKKLLEFLQPQRIDVYIHEFDNQWKFQKLREFLEASKRKIGFFIGIECDSHQLYLFMKTFASRIYNLKCSAHLLDNESEWPSMMLEHCIVSIDTVEQLSQVLRHNIKKLTIYTNRSLYEPDQDQTFIDELAVYNPKVEEVKLIFNGIKLEQINQLVISLIRFCPNLVHLSIDETFNFGCRKLDSNLLRDLAASYHIQLRIFYQLLPSKVQKLTVNCNAKKLMVNAHEFKNRTWINNLQQNCSFADWIFSRSRGIGYVVLRYFTKQYTATFSKSDKNLERNFNVETLLDRGGEQDSLRIFHSFMQLFSTRDETSTQDSLSERTADTVSTQDEDSTMSTKTALENKSLHEVSNQATTLSTDNLNTANETKQELLEEHTAQGSERDNSAIEKQPSLQEHTALDISDVHTAVESV